MNVIERIGRVLLVLSMVVMTLSVALSVVFRYVVNRPLLWSDEVASSSLAWMTFIGAAMLYAQRSGHLNLTILLDRVSPSTRQLMILTADVIELLLLVVVFIGGLVFIHYNRESVTSALELPIYLVFGIAPAMALLAACFLIRRMRRGEPSEPETPVYRGEHG